MNDFKPKRKFDALLALDSLEEDMVPKLSKITSTTDVLVIGIGTDRSKREKNNWDVNKVTNTKVEIQNNKKSGPMKEGFDKSNKKRKNPVKEESQKRELPVKKNENERTWGYQPFMKMLGDADKAFLSIPKDKRKPLLMSDIQSLLAEALLGDDSPIHPHRFCAMYNTKSIQNITCLILDGIGINHFDKIVSKATEEDKPTSSTPQQDDIENDTALPQQQPKNGDRKTTKSESDTKFLERLKLVEVVSPVSYGGDVVQELALVTTPNWELEKMCENGETVAELTKRMPTKKIIKGETWLETDTVPSALHHENKKAAGSKLALMMNLDQLVKEGYPLPIPGYTKNFKHFVHTKDEYGEVTEKSQLIGVDCEMCQTTMGSQLTYVALVTDDLQILYKSFVKTTDKVVNYLTQFSGVRKEDLQSITTTLADVQKAIRELLPKDCILVGHSLSGDLNALQMMHPYVIDTSVCFNLKGGVWLIPLTNETSAC
jgi:RNA exonuclease 1